MGSLLLDRSLRQLVGHFAQYGARDRLARVLQICALLSLDSLSEVNEFYGTHAVNGSGGGGAWRLTVAEVKQFLQLHVQFQPADIARLRF